MNYKHIFYFVIGLSSCVANTAVPPWWITDGNKTWPKAFWIGITFDCSNKELVKIQELINLKFAEYGVTIAHFTNPRIVITSGKLEDAHGICSLHNLMDNISWNKIEKSLQINQLAVDGGLVGLLITYDQFPELSKIRSKDLFLQFSRKKIKNLSYYVPGHGFILVFGYLRERKRGFSMPIDINETVNISLSIKQIEYLVMLEVDQKSGRPITESELNNPMYRSASFYAKNVNPKKKSAKRIRQSNVEDRVYNTINIIRR
jgi:hypothetical protein